MKKGVDWDYVCGKLQRVYDLALSSTDDFGFYINLINYISYFDHLVELQELIKGYIVKTAETDNLLLKKYEDEIIKEAMVIFAKLNPYLEQNNIETPELKQHIEHIPLLNEDKAFYSNGKMKGIYGNLNRMLYITWEFDNGKHKPFLKQFGKMSKDGTIHWDIAEKHDKYDEEEARIKRIGLTKIWYHWDKIAFFYNLYIEYEKMRQEWYEKGRFMTVVGINEAYKELSRVLGLEDKHTKPEPPYFFIKSDMSNALKQFHFHFLDIAESVKGQKMQNIKSKYSHKRKELTIKDKIISFQGSKRADLLNLLFKEGRKIYFDEALEHIEGIKASSCDSKKLRGYKKNFINYCDGINSRVADKGFTDFLFSDSNSVSINPLYH